VPFDIESMYTEVSSASWEIEWEDVSGKSYESFCLLRYINSPVLVLHTLLFMQPSKEVVN